MSQVREPAAPARPGPRRAGIALPSDCSCSAREVTEGDAAQGRLLWVWTLNPLLLRWDQLFCISAVVLVADCSPGGREESGRRDAYALFSIRVGSQVPGFPLKWSRC